MWSLYRPRSAAKPHDGSHRAKHRRVTSWTAKVQRVQRSTGPPWPTFRLVHLLHRSGFKLWSLKVSKYEVVCRVYKKVSSGWISDMTLTFFAMISRLYIGSIGSLSKAFSQTTPVQHQTLWCSDHRSCAVPSSVHVSIFFWYLTSLSNRGASMLLQKALLPFDVRNLARPGWTYLTVKTNWMFLDFLRRNYSTNLKDLPHFSKWKSSESSDRPNSLWPSSPSKPIA